MENTMFFFKPDEPPVCLKIFNAEGDELSLAGGDTLTSLDICLFKADNPQHIDVQTFAPLPHVFLEMLAAHLGYKIEKL